MVPIPADLKFWKMRGEPQTFAYLFLYPEEVFIFHSFLVEKLRSNFSTRNKCKLIGDG